MQTEALLGRPSKDSLYDRYLMSIKTLLPPISESRPAKFVFTALHGVGKQPFIDMLRFTCGGNPKDYCVTVKDQDDPDPEFTTVKFPNPEEEGALDLAMKTAEEHGCNIVLAVDPDADRFAASERSRDGTWHRFSGNQIGVLLAAFVLETLEWTAMDDQARRKVVMLTSTVSTGMLKTISEKEGFTYEETLTGFKWMGNRAKELEEQGYQACFAFEEALGYMFPQVIHDKDGISAGAMFLTARTKWAAEGLTPLQKLETLYRKYGYFADANTYLTSSSPAATEKAFTAIRASQREQSAGTKDKPAVLAGMVCRSYRDLTTGVDTSEPDGRAKLPVDVKSHMITCELDDARFTIRGSGTEPKVKLYVESRGDTAEAAQKRAKEVQELIISDWLSSLRA